MRYKIPHTVLTTFLDHAVNNFAAIDNPSSSNALDHGNHIETLAFLVGRDDGEETTATEIIFPKQKGTPCHVEDLGKLTVNSCVLVLICFNTK